MIVDNQPKLLHKPDPNGWSFADRRLADRLVAPDCCDVTCGDILERLVESDAKLREQMLRGEIQVHDILVDDLTKNGTTSSIVRFTVGFESGYQRSMLLKIINNRRLKEFMVNLCNGRAQNLRITPDRKPDEKMDEEDANNNKQLPVVDATERTAATTNNNDACSKQSNVCKLHNRECTFYALFGGRGVLPLPRIHFLQFQTAPGASVGIIAMEDLTFSTRLITLCEGYTADQFRQVVDAMARFHAHLLCSPPDAEWRRRIEPFEFLDVIEGSEQSMVQDVVNQYPALGERLLRIRRTLSPEFLQFVYSDCMDQLGLPKLVVHGDLWSHNLLWAKKSMMPDHFDDEDEEENGDELQLRAIIDFQLNYRGNFMADFARLLTTSAHGSRRLEFEQWLVPRYYTQLCTHITANGGEPPNFSVFQLTQAYRYAKVNQAMLIAVLLPFVDKSFRPLFHDDELERFMSSERERAVLAVDEAITVLESDAPHWLD